MKSGPLAAMFALLAACAPHVELPGPTTFEPQLRDYFFHAADGTALPYRVWMPDDAAPKAVIVALHGFNDYANFFALPGEFLRQRGIATYAYDQRGFGATAKAGLWPGAAAMKDDLRAFARLIRARHPGVPLHLLGESMGGAVILTAAEAPLEADGVILSAPAVWGRVAMPWYQRFALWLGARATPWAKVSGRGLDITPSDNIEMLRALGRDPLVLKETRVDAVHGLVDLMDEALEAAARFEVRALILYGRRDEIIPKAPTRLMLDRLPESARARQRVAFYAEGYHMLLRDLGAEVPWRDIEAWIADASSPLPSGADRVSAEAFFGAALGGTR